MEHCRIINYSKEWRDRLRSYMVSRFPIHTEAYIDYCIDHSDNHVPSKLVLNDEDAIVGCHLFYATKVMLNGEVQDTLWGHDTLVDEAYRAEAGWPLVLSIQAVKGRFGLGLTEMNIKIHKQLKFVFFEGVYTYYTITRKVFLTPFQKRCPDRIRLYDKETLKVGKHLFRRVLDAETLTIPCNGFWFNGSRDIDFIRDALFLNDRFVRNRVHNYYMYACEEEGDVCYVVVRQASYRGLPALTLCDFRYSNAAMVPLILRAAKKLAVKSQLGIVLFVCGDVNVDNAMKRTLHFKKPMAFVGNRKLSADMTYCITGADSDADFLR
jgi:hypothetical protein